MSLPTVNDASCAVAIEQLRRAIAEGSLGAVDPSFQLAVIKFLIAKAATVAAALNSGTPGTITHDVDVAASDINAQFTILNAFTGADPAATIVDAIATAWGLIGPDTAAIVNDANAVGGTPTVPTFVTNAVADG